MTEYVATRSVRSPCASSPRGPPVSPLMHARATPRTSCAVRPPPPPQMVPRARGDAHVQGIHPRDRYLERRVRARGDAEQQAALPRQRLYVASLALSLAADGRRRRGPQTTTSCRSSWTSSARRRWTTFTRSPRSGRASTSARCRSGRRSRSARSSRRRTPW